MIFEESTSALYYSNDGRLRLVVDREHDKHEDGTPLALSRTAYALELDGVEVFRTFDRVKSDAYIAGYDLALARATSDAQQVTAS